VKFIVGINNDGWPTAIPLDRVREIRIDPDDAAAVIEFRDDPTISQTLDPCIICDDANLQNCLRIFVPKKDARCDI